jgi:hypothetical protein
MRPHDWLFVGACAAVALVFAFRVACRALDMLDGRGG